LNLADNFFEDADLADFCRFDSLVFVDLRNSGEGENNITSLENLFLCAGQLEDIWIDGNPVCNDATYCHQVMVLEGHGAVVQPDLDCESYWLPGDDPEDTLDSDEDGYHDADEYAYLSLYYPDPLFYYYDDDPLDANPPVLIYPYYDAVSDEDLFPGWDWDDPEDFPEDTWPDCIPTVDLHIAVQGEGVVLPAAGTYTLAKYERTCELYCNTTPGTAPPGCDFNSVMLTPYPAPGWTFDMWIGELADELWPNPPDGSHISRDPIINLNTGFPRHVWARFLYRPGIDTMDLVDDLGWFLVAAGVNESVEDVWDVDYDRGDFELSYGDHVFLGNGIPDAAEFYLLQAVLQDKALDLTPRGGV